MEDDFQDEVSKLETLLWNHVNYIKFHFDIMFFQIS